MARHFKYSVRLILICCFSTLLSLGINKAGIGKENTLMVFLVGVLAVSSITRGYLYGCVASFFSVMLFNYFFTEPYFTLLINNVNDVILLAFFLLASLIASTMTSKLQDQTAKAKQNERTARLLYEITKGFLNVTGVENIVHRGMRYIEETMKYPCRVKLYAHKELFLSSAFKNEIADEEHSYAIPIKGLANEIGTLECVIVKTPLPPEDEMLLKSIVYQMALVLDRECIYHEREKIRIAMESEHLKSTLLRSISHDLRTPLTGIIGASDLIIESYDSLDQVSVKKLVSDIREESSWLIKSVQNILDMTLISEGKMTIQKNYEAVDDLISQAVRLVPQLASSGRLTVSTPEEIIIISVDGRLMVHALINLLDNACKHAGDDTAVFLRAFREERHVVFEISDEGPGIDTEIMDTLFEGFVTSHKNVADGKRGVGLGLAICKAIVHAHQGILAACNRENGGALFRMELPAEEE